MHANAFITADRVAMLVWMGGGHDAIVISIISIIITVVLI